MAQSQLPLLLCGSWDLCILIITCHRSLACLIPFPGMCPSSPFNFFSLANSSLAKQEMASRTSCFRKLFWCNTELTGLTKHFMYYSSISTHFSPSHHPNNLFSRKHSKQPLKSNWTVSVPKNSMQWPPAVSDMTSQLLGLGGAPSPGPFYFGPHVTVSSPTFYSQ